MRVCHEAMMSLGVPCVFASSGTRQEQKKAVEEESALMSPEEASKYRMIVARLNYLCMALPEVLLTMIC